MDPDGLRFGEPVTDRFATEIADDIAVNLKDGEGERIGQALVAAAWEVPGRGAGQPAAKFLTSPTRRRPLPLPLSRV